MAQGSQVAQGGGDTDDQVGAGGVADGEHRRKGPGHNGWVTGNGGVDQGHDLGGCVAVRRGVEELPERVELPRREAPLAKPANGYGRTPP